MQEIVKETQPSIVGRRMRQRREVLGLPQERVGVAIGLDESCARARISRYELGVHEPPYATVKRIAEVLSTPTPYFYCEDESLASLLLHWKIISAANQNDFFIENIINYLNENKLQRSAPQN